MNLKPIHHLNVNLCFRSEIFPVGKLAYAKHRIFFEYDPSFIRKGLELSPIKLPLKNGLYNFSPHNNLEGLPGLFYDSLPDGWGRLLLHKLVASRKMAPGTFSMLHQLAYSHHLYRIGALTYEPTLNTDTPIYQTTLDQLAKKTNAVLKGEGYEVLEELIALNGSSAGARPKAMIQVHKNKKDLIYGGSAPREGYEPWLVKFATHQDGKDAGAMEYVYALMARQAGVEVPEVHLFPAKKGPGYFAVKRFDREGSKRLHVHSACGLLHSDFRVPGLDYENLLALTLSLTKDIREVEKMYRLAVFNVLAYNRDDHSKNFSFLMDEAGAWKLSPAYDLTFSSGPAGEHSTMVLGEGKNPSEEHLKKLGEQASLSQKTILTVLEQTKSALSTWQKKAKEHGVGSSTISQIQKHLNHGLSNL